MAAEPGDGGVLIRLPLARPVTREPLGAILTRRAGLCPDALDAALARQAEAPARLGEILCSEGWLAPDALADALAFQHGLEWVDLGARSPDPAVCDGFDPLFCLAHGFVPAWRSGGTLVIATARPDTLDRIAQALPPGCGPVRLVHAPEAAVQRAIGTLWRDALATAAETRCPGADSCRGWSAHARRIAAAGAVGLAVALAVAGPHVAGTVVLGIAVLAMLATSGLKLFAAAAALGAEPPRAAPGPAAPLPRISLLVPLLGEAPMVADLVARLARLDYPRALLDVCLVIEADDAATRDALGRAGLPDWLRVIAVPPGGLRTKPRALNYALGFCRGDIVGVYDAEDKPAQDQLRRVAARFAGAGPDLACVQGTLDFYNRRANWLSRCFTIEYAVWFRIVLRGLAASGLPFPLGGTTMFVRRDVLEAVGGWDAHNVTEDADLGIRLARRGYRTALIDSVTEEEANCDLPAWIRQRSRWLKGFAMTWGVHMRRPGRLWHDLGPRGFLAFQIVFLGALAGFLCAPLLWAFWLVPLTGTVPFISWMPVSVQWSLFLVLILAEGVNLAIAVIACGARQHWFLRFWVPTMHAYFPLGALSAWRALYELLTQPFYWAKTPHGLGGLCDADPQDEGDGGEPAIAKASPEDDPPVPQLRNV